MAKGMKLRDMVRAMERLGCSLKSSSGIHDKWVCPCGRHSANLPRHTVVSPGVVRNTIKRLECLPEGWLQ